MARGHAHVAQLYILYIMVAIDEEGDGWAIESQLVIGHHPVHLDRLHPPIIIHQNKLIGG